MSKSSKKRDRHQDGFIQDKLSHDGLPEKADKKPHTSLDAETSQPKIKSSCLWDIPGDVPGHRRMPLPPQLTALTAPFAPPVKPSEPVKIDADSHDASVAHTQEQPETHSETHTGINSESSLYTQSHDHSSHDHSSLDHSSQIQSSHEQPSRDESSLAQLSPDQSQDKTELTQPAESPAKPSVVSAIDSNSTNASLHKQTFSNDATTGFRLEKTPDKTLDKSTETTPSTNTPVTPWQKSVSSPRNSEEMQKPFISAEPEPKTAKRSFFSPPEQKYFQPVTSHHTDTENGNKYRKFLPLLLLLLLMAGLGGWGIDYFTDENSTTNIAAIESEQTQIIAGPEVKAVPTILASNNSIQTNTYVEDTTDYLPAVEINLSGLEHRSISGVRMLTHVVVKGDTLWDISKAYLNNPFRYPELAKLSEIKNPDLIYPGNIVHIHIKTEN